MTDKDNSLEVNNFIYFFPILNRILSWIVIFIIRLYQSCISPRLREVIVCRFHPTCSNYGIIAIQRYGAFKGIQMTIIRIKRCRPDNQNSCIDFP